MRYDFKQMNADSFELMVRSLNERIFGVKCEQYGLGPDGQREFTFEGEIRDSAGNVFAGKTMGQVKYKYLVTKEDDYRWLTKEIDSELKRFRKKEKEYRPDHYFFFTNVVLTPARETGLKDKINAYVKANNDIIEHFYVKGYDDICAMLDNNRDVAACYAALITSGDVLMKLLTGGDPDNSVWMKKYLFCEFEEDMYTRMEQAGSATEKKISIEKVCVDINVQDREQGKNIKFAKHVFALGNQILGYKKSPYKMKLEREENFVVIGGPGNGKSTICQFIAQVYRASYLQAMQYSDQQLKDFNSGINYEINHQRIPFKIVLRDYAAWINRKKQHENVSVIRYIRERIRRIQGDDVSVGTIRAWFRNLAWIFFFDGLDEVPESSNRREVLKQIHIFISMELKEAECDCMIIGTTRAQGYNNDFDENKYKHMEVAEFSKDDCKTYIRKLFQVMEEQTERRQEYIRIMMEALEDEITGRLMETPLQATIIAILVKSGGKPPHERYSLFCQYYETVIRREKQKGIVPTLNDHTDWLEELHYLLGYRLQCESEKEDNASAEISREKLEKVIAAYVGENWDECYGSAEELPKKNEEFLKILTQRICFLCENRESYYGFPLRSIQEYFAGTYLVKGQSDEDAMDNVKRIAYSSYWRNALLFALGYIEKDRKSLEPQIGGLCEQMNGKNNVMREDYTSENLCLFGSWLALDILVENIFRGKQQEKYIVLASKAMDFADYMSYQTFSLITGVQKDKLLRYVREHSCRTEEDWQRTVRLYLKLNENSKNDLQEEILRIMEPLSRECRTEMSIYMLKDALNIRKQLSEWAGYQVERALEQGEIKYFLSYRVLRYLFRAGDCKKSLALRQALFLQCLYCNDGSPQGLGIWKRMEVQCNIHKMLDYLTSKRNFLYSSDTVTVTDSFEIILKEFIIDYEELKKIRAEMQKLELHYLSEFCDFLLQPTLVGYRNLLKQLEEEEEYLAREYRKTLNYYVPYEKMETEEEFQKIRNERRKDYQELKQGDYRKFYFEDTKVAFSCAVVNTEDTFDKLVDEEIPVLRFALLNKQFFRGILLVASVQIGFIEKVSQLSERTAERLLRLICESERRKSYEYSLVNIIAVLIASKFKKRLWESNPDFHLVDEMIDTELLEKTRYFIRELPCIGTAELRNITSSIVGKVIYEAKESNYLSIVPVIINRPLDLRRCISEDTMLELKRIEYKRGTNILAVKLLRMCLDENRQPEKILEDILACDVPRRVIYLELKNMLHYCQMANKEKLRVEVCLRLEDETFEGKKDIQKSVIEDMMEAKRTAAVK